MQFSTILSVFAAALIPTILAAPAGNPEGVSFVIEQVRNENFTRNGAKEVLKTLRKFGATIPQELQDAVDLAKRQSTGSASATPEQFDTEYLVPISIGTPAQTLNIDLDTGSSDLWVFSSETPASERTGHQIFTSTASSTAKTLSGATWSITYGDGSSSSGNVVTDVVKVGGITVSNQAVELAERVSDEFTSDTANAGILGMALDSINTVRPTAQKTFFFNAEAGLAAPLFTANLKHNAVGTYGFGAIDTTAFTGAITYTPLITRNGFWEVTGSGFAVGTGAFTSTSIDAIVDTGTTLLYLPSSVVSAYYAKVAGATNSASAGGFIFPCSATLPNFTFGIGTFRGVIPGSFINFAPFSGTQCFGGIQSNTGIGFSIFGDILLKAQYVVFDAGNSRVGFANKPT